MRYNQKDLEVFACQRLGYVGCSSKEQIENIINRCIEIPPPIAHSHSFEETGMCVECDAAWVIARYNEKYNEL